MYTHPKKQDGVALIFVLVLLLVLTILGVSGVEQIHLDEKMAHNSRNYSTAFHAAESGLSDGEAWVQSQVSLPQSVTTCATPPCAVWAPSSLPDLSSQSHAWWAAQGQPFGSNLEGVDTQPYYVVEETMFIPFELSPEAQAQGQGTHYYKVTSRGTGESDTAQAIVESVFSVFYN